MGGFVVFYFSFSFLLLICFFISFLLTANLHRTPHHLFFPSTRKAICVFHKRPSIGIDGIFRHRRGSVSLQILITFDYSMDSPYDRLIEEEEDSSMHRFFGGGFVADVILWRRNDVTLGILLGTFSAWLIFEVFGYTLISLTSRVLLLLVSILFVWAQAASVLNRPPPPIPKLHLSEAAVNRAASFVQSYFNEFFSAAYDVALGKNPKLFYKVAAFLWLLSMLGTFFDFLTIGYTGIFLILTLPVIYEKYEWHIGNCGHLAYAGLRHGYVRADSIFIRLRKAIVEKIHKIKLS